MTINEAREKAATIWGERRFLSARLREDGGADINLLRAGIASDTRDRNYSAHRLDVNGHATCHTDCATLEP